MKKTKFNPQLLKEELNRFKLINEYSFYKEAQAEDDDLLLGGLDEADEEPEGADAIANDLGVPPPDAAAPDVDFGGEPQAGDAAPAEDPAAPPAAEVAPEAPMAPIEGPAEEPAGDEVELVKSYTIKNSAV